MIDIYNVKPEDITKEAIGLMSQDIIAAVSNGSANALSVHMQAKAIKLGMEDVIKQTEADVWLEVAKYGKSFVKFGATVQTTEGSNSCDYSSDDIWQRLNAELKRREEILKIAFQNACKGVATFDTETGEEIPTMKAKSTKPSIKIIFK